MSKPLALDVCVVVLVQGSEPEGNTTLKKLDHSVTNHQTNYHLLTDWFEGILQAESSADTQHRYQKHGHSRQCIPQDAPNLAECHRSKCSRSSVRKV